MKAALLLLSHLTASLARARESLPPPEFNSELDGGFHGFYPTRSFATAPDLRAPDTNFVQWDQRCDDGLQYFITPRGWSIPNPGPMILDRRGELVWAHHFENSFGGQAYNFFSQEYNGENYLTFWLGDDRIRGHGSGFYYLLNSSYDIVRKIGGANGMSADLHEFLILPGGTALTTIYTIVPGDVSAFRIFDPETNADDREPNYVWGCSFQEIDIETGDLVFEWSAMDHYSINETYRPIYRGGTKNDPWDWFHINSMMKDELENYLISARYTHSITYIDGKTKEIIWQLGGKRNSFMDLSGGNATNFAWQHDARFVSPDTFPNMYTPPDSPEGFTTQLLTLFDNAAEDFHYQFGLPLSRGLLLELTYPTPGTDKAKAGPEKRPPPELPPKEGDLTEDEKKLPAINGTDTAYTVRVIKSYDNPNWIRSSSQGSLQILPQGPGEDPKVFVGYGLNAAWTEFDANGTVLCDVHFAASPSFERGDVQSYRTYKMPWVGQPRVPPSARLMDDDSAVLVSWNGATEVSDWLLQSSGQRTDDDKAWTDVQKVPKHNFETSIPMPATVSRSSRFLRVLALNDNGHRLPHGASKPLDRGIMASYLPGISKKLPPRVSRMSGLKFFLIVVCNISGFFVLYELYRKYLSWRYGGGSLGRGGPLMFRKGPMGRLLGEV